jgi:hypothetical protein
VSEERPLTLSKAVVWVLVSRPFEFEVESRTLRWRRFLRPGRRLEATGLAADGSSIQIEVRSHVKKEWSMKSGEVRVADLAPALVGVPPAKQAVSYRAEARE